MAVPDDLRQQVEAAIMARDGVSTRNMMGTTAYMVRNRMFAFWVADGLVVKLPDRARQEFVDRKAGVLFQGPQGRGFGDWTRVGLETSDDVGAATEAAKHAYEYVRGGAGGSKVGKRKKGK
jgi:hypothetical protein